MNMLCRKSYEHKTIKDKQVDRVKKDRNPMCIPEIKNDVNVLKTLRRKSLNVWIDKSDGKDLYVFYGKVKLKVEEKETKSS